jgi:hypothetical protein
MEALTGKKPASNSPKITRQAASACQSFVKPIPIMTAPQEIQRPARKLRGPILRVRTVAGGWKTMYVMKKTRVTVDWYSDVDVSLRTSTGLFNCQYHSRIAFPRSIRARRSFQQWRHWTSWSGPSEIPKRTDKYGSCHRKSQADPSGIKPSMSNIRST